jgi:hypothetical protein
MMPPRKWFEFFIKLPDPHGGHLGSIMALLLACFLLE